MIDALLSPKGLALAAGALYLFSKSKSAEAAPNTSIPQTDSGSSTMPVSLAVPVAAQEDQQSYSPVVNNTPSPPIMYVPPAETKATGVEIPHPIVAATIDNDIPPPAPISTPAPAAPTISAQDDKYAYRATIAKKYGADPTQLDLNQPEIQYWDAASGIVRTQPNFLYKTNQLSLPQSSPSTIAPTVISLPSYQPNTVRIGSHPMSGILKKR